MRARIGPGTLAALAAAVVLSLADCGTAASGTRRRGGADRVVQDFCRRLGTQRGLAVLGLFADSARLDIEGVNVSFVGRNDIARLVEYGLAVHERLTVRNIEVAGDTVTCRLEESNDWLRLLAVKSVAYDGTFLVSGGRIAGTRLVLLPESRDELAGKLAGFLAWLVSENPEVLEQLLPGGRPAYDARIVPELIKRLRQWRLRPRR